MAKFRREIDECYGRDFSVGLCSKIVTFATTSIALGGAGWYLLYDDSADLTNPYVVLCDTAAPNANDYNTGPTGLPPKYLRIGYLSTEPGYIRFHPSCRLDPTGATDYLNVFGGYRIATLDAANFNYVLFGGEECFAVMTTHTSGQWFYGFLDEWEGVSTLVEGTDKVGVLQSAVSIGSSVVCQLDTGEAANFTVDKWYYIYDFTTESKVSYVQVSARDLVNDTITLTDLAGFDYPAGSVIAAYAHRFYSMGSSSSVPQYTDGWSNFVYYAGFTYSHIPYVSHTTVPGAVAFPQVQFGIYTYANFHHCRNVWPDILTDLDPDDEGNYVGIRPLIKEVYSYYASNFGSTTSVTDMNRAYGRTKNMLKTARASMGQMGNYRTMNGIDYVNVESSSADEVYCFRYSEET